MEKAKLMQLEIEEKRKLPKKVKDEIVVKIFHTLIVAIIIIIYFLTVNLFFYNFEAKMFEECMKYYALIIIIATPNSTSINSMYNITGTIGNNKNSFIIMQYLPLTHSK